MPTQVIDRTKRSGGSSANGGKYCIGATSQNLKPLAQGKGLLACQGALKNHLAIDLAHLDPTGLGGLQSQF